MRPSSMPQVPTTPVVPRRRLNLSCLVLGSNRIPIQQGSGFSTLERTGQKNKHANSHDAKHCLNVHRRLPHRDRRQCPARERCHCREPNHDSGSSCDRILSRRHRRIQYDVQSHLAFRAWTRMWRRPSFSSDPGLAFDRVVPMHRRASWRRPHVDSAPPLGVA
jgi:hypothetical protein